MRNPISCRSSALPPIFMKISIGIVGLPNVGKSTLFKALTQNQVHIANYPFATIDPNIGVVEVPDERLNLLSQLSESKKTVPAVVEFYDIAGLVKGASEGQGLGNQFLSHIRETAAIVHVVRCFKEENIVHVEQKVDPERDIDIIRTELALKDLDTVKKRKDKLSSETKSGNRDKVKELEVVTILEKNIQEEKPFSSLPREITQHPVIKEMNLLSVKPEIYLLNGTESDVNSDLRNLLEKRNLSYVVCDLNESSDLSSVIKKAYEILNLVSFFTTGEDETRAWTIKKGEKAPQAAGAIHSDFEKKFIRAEVVFWKDLLDAGGWVKAKQHGKIRLEGKDYEVKDGDVMVIRHG